MKEKINIGLLATAVVFMALTFFESIIITQYKIICDEEEKTIDYWVHVQDSTAKKNFELIMQIYDLKDSIMTIKNKDYDGKRVHRVSENARPK